MGGDGTISETVNGFYDGAEPVAPAAELAVVSRGSGGDFARKFRIPKATDAALEVAAHGAPCARSTWAGSPTRPATAAEESRLYCNVASAGLTGTVAERINRSGKPLGATVAFAWGAVATFFGYRNSRFRVRIDERELDQVCNNVIVGNCRYFASGMKILPMAEPDDGLLDVLVWGDVGKVDLALNLHRLYRGTHVNHPKADFSRATRVVVAPEHAASDRGRRRAARHDPGDVRGGPRRRAAAGAGQTLRPSSPARPLRAGRAAWRPRLGHALGQVVHRRLDAVERRLDAGDVLAGGEVQLRERSRLGAVPHGLGALLRRGHHRAPGDALLDATLGRVGRLHNPVDDALAVVHLWTSLTLPGFND